MRASLPIFFVSLVFGLTLTTGFAAHADGVTAASDTCLNPQSQTTQVETLHSTVINGKTVNYKATVGFIEVTSRDLSAKACLFYTSYVVPTAAGEAPRPLIFAFNGGPGSASVWLHLGLLGPQRVNMGADGLHAPSVNALMMNDSSILDVSDVVLIDPVNTGFSHVTAGDANQFFGVTNDYVSVENFIQNYLNANNRWPSPKFLIGESYGGVRGSLLANHLQSDLNIGLSGLILVSPELSDTSLNFSDPDNNVPYRTYLPTMATSAWYHGKIANNYKSLNVDTVFNVAQNFANTVLRDALDQGSLLDQAHFEQVAQQIADFTGLNVDAVKAKNLRVNHYYFLMNFLSSENQVAGRYDSRFTAIATNTATGISYSDPSGNLTAYPFATAINQYLRVDLGWQSPAPYNIFATLPSWPSDTENQNTDMLLDLGQALAQNPDMRLMIANGYYDFACPIGTADYEVTQIPGARSFSSRISLKRYAGGHMMYINPTALVQLKADIAEFISGKKYQQRQPTRQLH